MLTWFSKLIEEEIGVAYKENNNYALENRLNEILREHNFSSFIEIQDKITTDSKFKKYFLDKATNNETFFFRDEVAFTNLEKNIFPELKKKSTPLKLWSAAASGGQEAISCAIIAQELSMNLEITATDISSKILTKAAKGLYSDLEIRRGLPEKYVSKYFDKLSDSYEVKSFIKKQIKFEELNLLKPFTVGPFDIILCRNVLVYFSLPNKQQVLKRIHSNLKPGGILILGAGESLLGISDQFDSVNQGGSTYFIKKA